MQHKSKIAYRENGEDMPAMIERVTEEFGRDGWRVSVDGITSYGDRGDGNGPAGAEIRFEKD